MKKIAILIMIACATLVTINATAQAKSYYIQPKTAAGVSNDTLTNADTLYATLSQNEVENHIQSLRAVVKKVDGDPSSVRVYLQGRQGPASSVSDGEWDTLDSLVCTNQAINKKTFNLRTTSGNLIYVEYRLFGKGAGTTNAVFQPLQTRRRGDN